MRILGWIFVPFVMIFKNWQQRAVWANAIGSIFALCMLSFYTLVVFVSLTGGAFLADLPLDLRGVDAGCTKSRPNKTPGGNCGK
jgi:uncharacterized metal-binding protein